MESKQKQFNDTSMLSALGSRTTDYDLSEPKADIFECFKNTTSRPYIINIEIPEWTGMCPKTGQPDFAHISIAYMPRDLCIESKSMKLYIVSYRNYGCFMESTTNKFIDDMVAACQPYWIKVQGIYNPRGGIDLNVNAEYYSSDIGDHSEYIPQHVFGKDKMQVPAFYF